MLMKRNSANGAAGGSDTSRGRLSSSRLQSALGGLSSGVMDRRAFLRRSGLVAGGLAVAGSIQIGAVRKAEAAGFCLLYTSDAADE